MQFKYTALVFAVLLHEPCFAIETVAKNKSLNDAIAYGLSHSPRLKQTAEQQKISDLQLTSSNRSYLPNLSANASAGLGETNPNPSTSSIGPNPQSQFELKLTEPLYDNGVREIKQDIAKFQNNLSQIQAISDRDQFVLDVIMQYIEWSQSEINFEANQEQQKIVEKQLKTATQNYKQGMSTKNDYFRIQSESQRSLFQLEEAKNSREESYSKLLTLIGASNPTEGTLALNPLKPDYNPANETSLTKEALVAESIDQLVDESVLEKSFKLNDQISEKNTEQVRKKLFPEFSLSAAAGYQTQDYLGKRTQNVYENDSTYWNVTLGVNYTLWDWGQTRREIGISASERALSSIKHDLDRAELRQKLESLQRQIHQDQKSLKLSYDVLKLEESSFSLMETEYRNGKASYLDLSTSIKSLLSARLQYASAFFNFMTHKYELLYYKGKIYETTLAS